MKPVILIATTTSWVPTARLAMALRGAGFIVDMVCPSSHPVHKTGVARHIYFYSGLRPLATFARAIAAAKPDLIAPGDDLATRHLHRLHASGSSARRVIERSLGAKDSFRAVSTRANFMQAAQQEGLRVPHTEAIRDSEDLEKWLAGQSFPFVLKADGSSGGEGVKIVKSREQAERAFRLLKAPPLWARAWKRTLLDRDSTLLWPSLLRTRPSVIAQAFVSGTEATSAVACKNGGVLAALHFEVIKKAKAAGHATVIRRIENADMAEAAEVMVRRLCLSGLHGLDFMIDEATRSAHLIEINPRSTQTGHLTLGPGGDLCAALYAAVSGEPVRPAQAMTDNATIALFPNELLRDAASPYLVSGYHDVPWDAPELVRACSPRGSTGLQVDRLCRPAMGEHGHRSLEGLPESQNEPGGSPDRTLP